MSHAQLHNRRTTEQVVDILEKYLGKEIKATEAMAYLNLGHTRFYELVATYKEASGEFSLVYARTASNNRLSPAIEKHIRSELEAEKQLIENKDIPVYRYNYSYVRDQLLEKYGERTSVTSIINRAKQWDFYLGKPPKKQHDREVITNYTGELIQHDSSYHLFVPLLGEKLYLTTSLDDFSRALLYAQHSNWYAYQKFTDDVDPQWRQVLKELTIEPIPALSPQAKGKIERPYGWIQDRMVRACMREEIRTLDGAQEVLNDLVYQYNWKWRHSTTGEIPMERYQDALREKRSLWRKFVIREPYTDVHDIFCLRTKRIVDAYRTVSISTTKLKVPAVPPRHEVELRLAINEKKQLVEVRFWFKGYCVGRQTVKRQELKDIRF